MKWTPTLIALFVGIQIASFILAFAGIFIIAALAITGSWVESVPPQWKGGWATWVWGNEEDGIFGPGAAHTGWRAFYWSAYRNSVGNLRFVTGVSGKGRPDVQWHYGNRVFWAGWHQTDGWPVFHPFLKASDLPV